MPISGPSSYVITTNEFIAHWDLANIALGAGGPVVMRNPNGSSPATLNRANLITYRDDLQAKQSEIQGQINSAEIARAELVTQKVALHLRATQFNDKVRGVLGNTAFAPALPAIPGITEGQGNFVPALDDIATLWAKINAAAGIPGFTGPLLLLGGYAVAEFTTALAALKAQFELVGKEELGVTLKIAERNLQQDVIYPVLKAYRQVLPTFFAANSPLIASLPRLTPEPGSTPDAVLANGTWDVPTTQGKLTWDEPTSPEVVEFEVRWSPGPDYDADTEVVLANIPVAGPREYSTTQGLLAIGDVSNFKIYTKTATGNERGSNTVKITRTT